MVHYVSLSTMIVFVLNVVLGPRSARKTETSSSLGIDDKVADVFRQGGGLPAARAAIMVAISQSLFLM